MKSILIFAEDKKEPRFAEDKFMVGIGLTDSINQPASSRAAAQEQKRGRWNGRKPPHSVVLMIFAI